MLKIKEFFMNELVITILSVVIVLGIFLGIMCLTRIADQKRCEENGGKYIWEWSYGTKCHLKD